MISAILTTILILAIYVFIYNLAIFIPAKKVGIRVDAFSVFFAPFFNPLKKVIKGTEFSLGWLPLGGSVKLSGTYLEEDEEAKPTDFLYYSPATRIFIYLCGPLSNLLVGLLLFSFFYATNLVQSLTVFGLIILSITLLFYGYIKIVTPLTINSEIQTSGKKIIVFSFALLLHSAILIGLCYFINQLCPLFETFQGIITGNLTSSFFSGMTPFEILKTVGPGLGITFFIMNLLPFGGLIGSHIVGTFYQTITGQKLSDKLLDRFSMISFPLILILYGRMIYLFFF